MCGIIGSFGSNCSEITQNHLETLNHRGPDSKDLFVADNINLGHVRLAIRGLDLSGHQPMVSECKRYVIAYNGELYNVQELAAEFGLGEEYMKSDTRILLESYAIKGRSIFSRLKGTYSFVIYDRKTCDIVLHRDRLGVKPLYYALTEAKISFSSEMFALSRLESSVLEVNRDALSEYLSFQSVKAPNTLLKEVKQLMPGEVINVKLDENSKLIYESSLEDLKGNNDELPEQSIAAIGTMVTEAILSQMISDVPIGLFLSAGIDSSIICQVGSQNTSGHVSAVTVGFKDYEHNEGVLAKDFAEKIGLEHKLLEPDSEAIEKIFQGLNEMDSPSGDGLNTWLITKFCSSSGFKVALSGLGADEIFGGYPSSRRMQRLYGLKLIWPVIHCFYSSYVHRKISSKTLSFIYGLMKYDDLEKSVVYSSRTVFTPYQIDKILNKGYRFYDNIKKPSWIKDGISFHELNRYTIPVLLKDSDQMSMANSVELRVPFLDEQLVRTMLTMGNSRKRGNTNKWILVDSFRTSLGSALVNRKKTGFGLPLDNWIKETNILKVEELFQYLGRLDFFNHGALLNLLDEYKMNRTSVTSTNIIVLISFALWHKKFFTQ